MQAQNGDQEVEFGSGEVWFCYLIGATLLAVIPFSPIGSATLLMFIKLVKEGRNRSVK